VWATWPIHGQGSRERPDDRVLPCRRECIDGIAFQPTGFKLLLEILVRGRIRSLKELPLNFGLRSQGVSKANFKSRLDYAKAAGPPLCREIRPGRQS